MSAGGSILLDVLRFGAACTVLLSHFGHVNISVGFPDLTAAGHLAVAVFFVLSGFVIRYVTLTRDTGAGGYVIDRVSRIYSVAGPALLITLCCEFAAWAFYPHYYALVRVPFAWRDVPFQVTANLFFQAQDWGYEISPLSNAPFWSLSFECLYYAVYGLLFYRVRGWAPMCLLLLLIAGPSITLMLPVWLLGCFAFDAYRKLSISRMGIIVSSTVFAAMSLTLFAARVKIREVLLIADEAHRTAWLSRLLMRVPHHQLVFAGGRVPWLAYASASFLLVGIVTAVFTTWALLVLDGLRIEIAESMTRCIRFVADSTFALYLLHLPILILVVCVLGKPISGWGSSAIVLGLIIIICVGVAVPLDALKRNMRFQLERLR